ncbi:MAG: S1-like domain-containing RNA-binding protein [Eubacteriales bacterium]|nr:S1-like domain-containing RNA-binding protein [Eubacteriales bacterium]
MNDNFEKRAYPCDVETNKRAYPCDIEEPKRSYPCDTEDTNSNEKVAIKGKGRRGGNASASIVVRSGKEPEHGDYTKDRYQWREEREKAEKEKSFLRDPRDRRDSFRRDAFRKDDRRDSFRRDDRRDGFRREDRESLISEQEYATPLKLKVIQNTEIGAFLDLGNNKKVLLPFAEQTVRPEVGEEITVYLYEDKGGRATATMRKPILKDGEVGILNVAEVTKIGAFLNNGVPKQILVPFREQICTPKEGDDVLVYIYRDKSGRQAATMRVYKFLDNNSPYKVDDKVQGFIYEINPKLGVFVAVDNKYFGMIPISEVYTKYKYGDIVEARVTKVREDGKLDLSGREKAYIAIEQDAEAVMYELKRNNGKLPYADKADAAFIEETYAMSKNQFKRAVGHLFKQKLIMVDREKDTITLL